ncbi:MAG: HD domain-containing protein [Chloroflexi bacterium AL-W]|nr:HD domain-containing protein [Chloroflexi bacterium AL-N1]NOK70573.1 HD domain-containing protein [Chloroflexi bacterium AL-N10]NOK77565.1 HD domain-containing protein [Chloroflexi bacterium AL-N5]NOK84416.1 HD domain-containing protein [Chloroflexi bacterium AL-W]NOK92305.1 HD domain-containing protein [Chloroflexi bacterium AL-N15]
MNTPIQSILQLLQLSERLKFELRHSWLSSGRQESVAEHTWQMALMAILAARQLEHPVNLERVLKMILIHDLVEADAGDVPFFEVSERRATKTQREQAAIDHIRDLLDDETGQEIYDLWYEFEERQTNEAKFATALDHLEVQIQHNHANISTWETLEYGLVYTKMDVPCEHDAFLQKLCVAVKQQSEEKLRRAGVDIESVKANL